MHRSSCLTSCTLECVAWFAPREPPPALSGRVRLIQCTLIGGSRARHVRARLQLSVRPSVPLSCTAAPCGSTVRQTGTADSETRLEAGDAVCAEQSGFKTSSGDHPGFASKNSIPQYTIQACRAYAMFFLFSLQNIYKNPLFRAQTGKAPARNLSHAKQSGFSRGMKTGPCVSGRVCRDAWRIQQGREVFFRTAKARGPARVIGRVADGAWRAIF